VEQVERSAAPGELELVRQFLNTHDVETGTDEIGTPAALRDWLASHGLDPGRGLAGADVEQACRLRDCLRALALANNGESIQRGTVPALNKIAARMRLSVRFDPSGGSALEPAGRGSHAALAELLAIVFRSMAQGTWSRLKACRADTCQWAFYDHSKNRSGAWCSMAVCGNRAKARTYRRRHSHAAG
jgi:predicted RNA-binding Zn ribbon-like protein